jgi:hypothetical protein
MMKLFDNLKAVSRKVKISGRKFSTKKPSGFQGIPGRVFPTGVGMNRLLVLATAPDDRVPHRRGDEPMLVREGRL